SVPPSAGAAGPCSGDAHTQLQQFTRDPRVAPARVLPRQAQDELANATLDRRPTAGPLRLCPPAAYELSVPAQQASQSTRAELEAGASGSAPPGRRDRLPETTAAAAVD